MNANFILLPLIKYVPLCCFAKSDNNSLATQLHPCNPYEYVFPPVTLLGKEDQHCTFFVSIPWWVTMKTCQLATLFPAWFLHGSVPMERLSRIVKHNVQDEKNHNKVYFS